MKKKRIVCFSVSAVILAIVLVLNVAVGVLHDTIDRWVVGYKSGAENTAVRAAGEALVEQIQEEGTVLVRNEANAEGGTPVLPLGEEVTKVNVFGWASVDWVYSGSGSGTVAGTKNRNDATQTQLYDLYDALDEYGVEYNTELKEMYTKYKNRRDKANSLEEGNSQTAGALHSFNYEFSMLYEPSVTDESYYSQAVKTNAQNYSDTALVVLGRITGESNDCPKVQYKYRGTTDTARTYLEISQEEEALLKYVGENFGNVVVLINSTNAMELGFLEEIPGLDACLIVGATGSAGAKAIPELLWGKTLRIERDENGEEISRSSEPFSPSGRTADTYAYDFTTNPTYVNTGAGIKGTGGQGDDTTAFYTNSTGLYPMMTQYGNGSSKVNYTGVAYTDYQESIYVGYKWYETADAAGFWASDKAKAQWGIADGYKDVVQYPFGFGLSYTSFAWEVRDVKIENGSASDLTAESVITFEVAVTNTGTVPGQDVVELYYTAPYTEGGIEKASVNLIAFGKTQQVLKPGDTESVLLEVKADDMKSYDCYDANGNGFAGYELEGGKYVLSLRTDAHTLATDRLGKEDAEYTYTVKDTILIENDSATGEPVENRFTAGAGVTLKDEVAIDGNSDETAEITYLSRENFEGTFPYERAAKRAMADTVKKYNTYTKALADEWLERNGDAKEPTMGADGGLLVYDTTKGADGKPIGITDLGRQLGQEENYDNDDLWDPVLDQLTQSELQALVLHGYTKTEDLASVGKPESLDLDGPNQIGSFDNGVKGTTGFNSVVLAQTWNTQLAYSMGLAVAQDSATKGINGWYGPAMNLHRSPFGGRNYEYYSEDAYLSGIMAANEVEAAKNGGVFCYLKHLCLYESESGRDGMYNWLTEQALREAYIKPFEICVKEGGATGIMTSYGRIGAIWTGGSEALLQDVVRGEWGFKGAILTDYADFHQFMSGDHMIRSGGDLWMAGYLNNSNFSQETNSAAFKQALRSAGKHVLYMYLNALDTQASYNEAIANGATDGVTIHTSSLELNFRWYIPVLIAVDVLALGGCGAWIFMVLRKKDAAPAEADGGSGDPGNGDAGNGDAPSQE